ncbi:MAG: hypothetical protein QM621_06345 [Aeromicrobium sp.]|uniref:hypothetical protein n=1 Tax=Aeromicrobium sp. TaxID=1871063 RepID=UPI0039E46B11
MSAATPIDTNRPGVKFGSLITVETRKMLDTRAGTWLLIITGLLIVFVAGVILLVIALNDNAEITASGFSQAMTIPLSILLPVFAITTVTSEWGQRAALTTFTLEPRRARVIAAKFTAVLILAAATIVAAILLGVIGNLLASGIGGYDARWDVDAGDLTWIIVLQLAYFIMAFAFATLILNSPATIAVFYVIALFLPMMVYSVLVGFFEWARELIPWIDFNYAATPLMTGQDMIGTPVDVGFLEWFRFFFSLTLLVVVPGVLGWMRVLRSEVK